MVWFGLVWFGRVLLGLIFKLNCYRSKYDCVIIHPKLNLALIVLVKPSSWLTVSEVEKVVDSASLTRRKYFQKLGLTENIWENIMI